MTTVDTGPAVQVMDHTGQWRNEEFFPPRDAQRRTYHLNTNAKLGDEPGAAGSVLLTPTPLLAGGAQFFRSLPGYSADFSTPPFEEDAPISGLVRLHVTVTPQGPTGHLVGYLYDVDETGRETRIGWSQINLQFADGTETRRNLAPGAQLLAKMQFEALDAFVKKGHILRLRVWEYQEADRLPAIPPEPVTLHWGGSVKSILEVPYIDRAPEAYFQPPMPPPR